MLAKEYKLNNQEIKSLFVKNNNSDFIFLKLIRDNNFDIKIFSVKNDNFCFKSAVIISGKIFKKAIERNKIKRRIYSILEKYLKEQKINNSFYILIYPKKPSILIEFQNLEKELYNYLNKNLIN